MTSEVERALDIVAQSEIDRECFAALRATNPKLAGKITKAQREEFWTRRTWLNAVRELERVNAQCRNAS